MSYSTSIIIPVRNDPAGIRQTLESVVNQRSEYYIVVIDNKSEDGTFEVIQQFSKEFQNVIPLKENEIEGAYAARNMGIRNGKGETLAFLDSDETVDSGWLETALEAMESQNVKYLGCNVELTLPEETLIGRYNARTGFPVKDYIDNEHFAPTCALLVRREVFEDVGLFDERLISGGDVEFGQRVHEAGYDQGFSEEATVYHPARTSFESLWKKNFRVGRGFCQKQRYYPERYGTPGIPPRPTGPGTSDRERQESLTTKMAFTLISLSMLLAKGLGYYYEFLFGKDRERRDAMR